MGKRKGEHCWESSAPIALAASFLALCFGSRVVNLPLGRDRDCSMAYYPCTVVDRDIGSELS